VKTKGFHLFFVILSAGAMVILSAKLLIHS